MLSELEIKSYEEAERFLLEIPKFTSKNPIDATRSFYQSLFCHALKNQTIEEKIIHIAGTNGKGSVCAYLQSILQLAGKKVGMFTSPHLVTMRERFRINGEMVSKALFLDAFLWVRKQLSEYQKKVQYQPTFFEMLFFMSIYIFTQENVDIILLETGLGGKLDATNVTERPALTIITEIGLDHMQYLGDTIEKIAGEKAGIIKENVPIVYGDYDMEKKEAAKVIEQIADKKRAKAYCLHKEDMEIENIQEKSIDFLMKSRYYDYIRLTVSTTALYQVENASLAVLAIDALQDVYKQREESFSITEKMIWQGIRRTKWEARMEEILPDVFLDGGHNQDGIRAFLQTVASRQQFHGQNDKNILLFSAVKDKSYEDMIRMIAESSLFQEICITSIPGIRGTTVEELGNTFRKYTSKTIRICKDVSEAWNTCLGHKGDKDTMYIVGSLYLAGLIKELL